MNDLMRAVVLTAPGPVTNLELRELPVPVPRPGWVLIRVRAFGVNRSELFTRLGFSGDAVTYPRVLGIEATGVVVAAPGGGDDGRHPCQTDGPESAGHHPARGQDRQRTQVTHLVAGQVERHHIGQTQRPPGSESSHRRKSRAVERGGLSRTPATPGRQ